MENSNEVLGNLTDSYQNMLKQERPKLSFDNDNCNKNLYSNVLTTSIAQSRIQPVPGPIKPNYKPAELQSWTETPTVHVYSNIQEKMHESVEIFLNSMPFRKRNSQNYNEKNYETELGNDELDDINNDNNNQDDRMAVSDDNDEINHNQHKSGVCINDNSTSVVSGISYCSEITASTQVELKINPSTTTEINFIKNSESSNNI